MKTEENAGPPPIVVRPHPPERGLRALARGEVAACCTTSTSSCCLHSLGSLAGAIAGSFYPRGAVAPDGKEAAAGLRDDELDGPNVKAPAGSSAVPVYWGSAAAAMALVFLLSMAWSGPQGLVVGLAIAVLALPPILLGGSVLCAVAIAANPRLQRDPAAWKRLGWITLGILAGTLIGVVMMWPLFRH